MFVLKLLLEIGAVLGLALLLRRYIGVPSSLSLLEDNRSLHRRLRGEWQWYSVIHLVLGAVFSVSTFWLIYGIFLVLHSAGSYNGVLIVNQAALMVPSLIIGFLGSGLFSRSIYLEIFGMNETIFEELQLENKRAVMLRKIFGSFMLVLAITLLSFQFKVYLKTDGENIYLGSADQIERTYAVKDIRRVSAANSEQIDIYLSNGEKISTSYYSGNINYFLDNISRK